MCGILGVFKINSFVKFEEALDLLHHRGPNDKGYKTFEFESSMLTIGQTRLSIIDLTDGGHQPMTSIDERYTIVFNGEIYNYLELKQELELLGVKFRSNSDTEVLLNAWIKWGPSCLTKLNGMFSFVVFDTVTLKITLVRDAFGIKPLFYYQEGNNFYFSSELNALIKLLDKVPSPNYQSAYDYLVWSKYDNDANTFLDGVFQLQPSHFITLELGNTSEKKMVIKPQRWWWPKIKESEISFSEASNKIREIFIKNVKLQMRSDVPIGAALSGGIDSSSIVCVMRYLDPKMTIHTFSYLPENPDLNEEKWIDIVNEYVGAIPHKIFMNSNDFINDINNVIKSQGEPFGSTSIFAQYNVFKKVKECGITVTLDGQGADELFAGYNGYPQFYIRSLIEKWNFRSAFKFFIAWSKWPRRSKKRLILELIASYLPPFIISFGRRLLGESNSPDWLEFSFFKSKKVKMNYPFNLLNYESSRERRLVGKLRNVLMGNGLSSLLRHGDRNSMNWSIESRVPFLSIEMAELILTLPEKYLVSTNGETKTIFREAMRGIVPDIILDRKDKIGFGTDELEWLRKNKKDFINIIRESKSLPLINSFKTIEEIEKILMGLKPMSTRPWSIINYCKWWDFVYRDVKK